MTDHRKLLRERCLEREEAFCSAVCPFHLDVREFVSRVSRGGFNAAYRLYSNTVGFPAIVSSICEGPCEAACPRDSLDRPVWLRMLEDASVRGASNTKPNNYNLPRKGLRVAIVGGGGGGLACALRLANRKYDVTVYDKNSRPGGNLTRGMDPGAVYRELELQFMYERYDFVPDTVIEDIGTLAAAFDAVYISTGAGGDSFGLNGDGAGPFASGTPGVFWGGAMTGASRVESIAHGLQASSLIEAYLKTGVMKGAPPRPPTKMILDESALRYEEPVIPENPASFSKGEAAREAARCVKCGCDFCFRHCGLLNYYDKRPRRLDEEIEATINPGTLDGNGTIVTRFISTCNQCGLCGEICPEGIDLGEIMRASHAALEKKGAMPWAFHEFWLRDMEFANGDDASLIIPPASGAKAEYVFFPGCQLGASDPAYVTEAYKYVAGEHRGAALALMCCGAPAVWAGNDGLHAASLAAIRDAFARLGNPAAILACPTCARIFSQYLPEIDTVLLYDIMAEREAGVAARGDGAAVSVFDPCSIRRKPETCDNVRKILRGGGYALEPLKYERGRAQCCSWGGQISAAAPKYSGWLARTRACDGDKPYVVYCSNCRDIFAGEGKPVKHLLDVAFGLGGWDRKPPTVSQRRRNRICLKQALLKEYGNERAGGEEHIMKKQLIMSGELREKLDKNRLIEEDILSVIEDCEAEGGFIIDPATSHRFGSGVVGNLTHWAEYAVTETGYELINAYSHRMSIEAGGISQ
jgi:Fe-S oxidoreductase